MKVVVFGASVSAQTKHHSTGAITGYSEMLRQRHASALGFSEIKQITYAGNRASDGGLVRLERVVASAPDICLFEPLIEDMTRGSRISDAEITHVYLRLLRAGILPITILLPNPASRVPNGWPEYPRYMAIAERYGVPVIRIDLTDAGDIDGKFNGIHTYEAGAEIYAQQIAEGIRALGDLKSLREKVTKGPLSGQGVYVRQHVQGDLPTGYRKAKVGVSVASSKDVRVRLLQWQTIGPFSPMFEVKTRGKASARARKWGQVTTALRSAWDPYCHYVRQSFITLAEFQTDGKAYVEVDIHSLSQDPDYASCRREDIQWPPAKDRLLKPAGPLVLISESDVQVVSAEFK